MSELLTQKQRKLCLEVVRTTDAPFATVNPRPIARLLTLVYDEWGKISMEAAQHAPPAVVLLRELMEMADIYTPYEEYYNEALKFCRVNQEIPVELPQ